MRKCVQRALGKVWGSVNCNSCFILVSHIIENLEKEKNTLSLSPPSPPMVILCSHILMHHENSYFKGVLRIILKSKDSFLH